MLRRHQLGVVGGCFVLFCIVFAIVGPWLAGHNPNATDLGSRLLGPMSRTSRGLHLLGTDELGRDTVARLAAGARASLVVAGTSLVVGGTIGSTLGIVAGYYGGIRDNIISRMMDAQLSLPVLVLAMVIAATMGLGFRNTVIAISIATWPVYARLMRAEVLRIRNAEFIEAATASGASTIRVIRSHVLPNVLGALAVVASVELGVCILLESALSFVGLGMQPPNASWGSMIRAGQEYVFTDWRLPTLPGFFIMASVLGLNLVGDWLRDVTDPRSK
jgi:peptide/nickel transport system permease protein